MRLPEYDNRPQPGEPLYSAPSDTWEDVKMTLTAIFGVVAMIAAPVLILGGIGMLLLSLLRAVVH